MNDVEFENYKDTLIIMFHRTLSQVDKTFKKDVSGFSITERRLALREVMEQMIENF